MDNAYIIAGLGNPGKKYDGTRHNIGFAVIDALAEQENLSGPVKFGKSLLWDGRIGGARVFAIKPQTYMNLSGEAVREATDYYRIDAEDRLIVICDDVNLPTGTIRIRKKGSAGGHNGLKNIIQHLGGDQFARIRIGVGEKPSADSDLANHVLGHFSSEDTSLMRETAEKAAEAVSLAIREDLDAAMNRFNTKKEKAGKKAAGKQEGGAEEKSPAPAESSTEGETAPGGGAETGKE